MPALQCTYDSVKKYLHTWQQDIDRIFGGKTTTVPTPFDRSNFFLDDVLPFKSVTIFDDIQNDFILTSIGPSRTLSLSLFIEPIYLLRKRLMFDQRLELCFAASFLSNPFWFDHVLRLLIKKTVIPMIAFGLDCIPFLIGYKRLKRLFQDNGRVGHTTDGPHVVEGNQFPICLGLHKRLQTTKEKSVACGWRRWYQFCTSTCRGSTRWLVVVNTVF